MVRCEVPDSCPHDGERIIPDYSVPRHHHQSFRDRLCHEQSIEGIFVQGGQGERTGCVIDRDREQTETIGLDLTGVLPAASGHPWLTVRDESHERFPSFGENDFLNGDDLIHQAREMGLGGLDVDGLYETEAGLNQVWSGCKQDPFPTRR